MNGPGSVTFGNPNQAATTASCGAAGTYVLRLSAYDGALTGSDDVTVTVNAPANVAPLVNAGVDQTITLPSVASLSGTAADDDLSGKWGVLASGGFSASSGAVR